MKTEIATLDREEIRPLCSLCKTALLPMDSFSPEDLEHGIFNDPCHDPRWTLVARSAGELVGVLNGACRESPGKPKTAVVKLFAVRPDCRRQRVASALFDQFEALCRHERVTTIQVGSVGPLYFFGGVDPRYTEAVIFLIQRGYEKKGDSFYLAVDLGLALPRYDDLVHELASSSVIFERPAQSAREEVREWVRSTFSDGWAHEAGLGFQHEPVTVWAARANRVLCGFAASNATGRNYFGPIGVAPDFRRRGIGRVLVVKCLEDMQRDGRRVAWIPTGLARIPFYHAAACARVGRTFWPFAKSLNP